MDLGLHRPARIAEAISAPTLPPETTTTIDVALDAPGQDCRHGRRRGGLAGELGVGVEPAGIASSIASSVTSTTSTPAAAQQSSAICAGERRVEAVGDRLGIDGRPARPPRGRPQRAEPSGSTRDDADAAPARTAAAMPGDEPAAAAATTTCRRRARPRGSRARPCPGPAITSGSSNGWTSTRPVSRSSARIRSNAAAGLVRLDVDRGAVASGSRRA